MGSRAWGAERRFPDQIGDERLYERSGESEALLPKAIADKAKELGWDEIWQLTYCQHCAYYAHDSSPLMTDEEWGDPELGDARQRWGPSSRSIFSFVDKDEAAWVIDSQIIGLYEVRMSGYWQYPYGRSDDFQVIDVPQWGWDDDRMMGGNSVIDAFWRSRPQSRFMSKLNQCVIQIPFPTRGAFAKFRDAMYADEDNPAETDVYAKAIDDILYGGPLYQFWKEIIIDDNYTWPDALEQRFSQAYAEQVDQITLALSDAYRAIFSDTMPISPSSPIQPQEFRKNFLMDPLNDNLIVNRRFYGDDTQNAVDVIFDTMKPLLDATNTLAFDKDGNVKIG